MFKISAAIITFNEEKNLERCLESLTGVVDEIVVLDSFSSDRTQSIAETFTVKFYAQKFKGHIEQKNDAIDLTTHAMVLSLDADEALSPELKASILTLKNGEAPTAAKMKRLTNYCGKWIRHSGWYPDKKIRLFNKAHARWGGQNPHDTVLVDKGYKVLELEGDLLHYSFYTKDQHIQQIHSFSDIASRAAFKKGKKSYFLTPYIKATAKFIKAYFIKQGILDGKEGWQISTLSAWASYLRYVKLRNLNRES